MPPLDTHQALPQYASGADVASFAAQYQQMLDSELLNLARQQTDLVPAAVAALDAELERRGLSNEGFGSDENAWPDMQASCPLCGFAEQMGHNARLLYEAFVCGSCVKSLWIRRALAQLIDDALYNFFLPIGAFVLVLNLSNLDLFWVPFLLIFSLYLIRDRGFLSPGKLLTGLEVRDTRTGKPAGYLASLKRNLALLIPFAPFIIAFQMQRGPRLGDGWAHTQVILKRYREKYLSGADLSGSRESAITT